LFKWFCKATVCRTRSHTPRRQDRTKFSGSTCRHSQCSCESPFALTTLSSFLTCVSSHDYGLDTPRHIRSLLPSRLPSRDFPNVNLITPIHQHMSVCLLCPHITSTVLASDALEGMSFSIIVCLQRPSHIAHESVVAVHGLLDACSNYLSIAYDTQPLN
jgi:hypothetical protein